MTNAMSAPDTVGASRLQRVELSLAADAQMLFLARMTGAAVAARAEFDFEEVEDLRLAIDELCIRLMGSDVGTGRISLVFQWDDEGALEVMATLIPEDGMANNGQRPRPVGTGPSIELSERILDALVDDHGGDVMGGLHRAWLRMKRQEHVG
jgi:hypothetical protein